jgi:glycosyltransferase involved in cell wall biosynthesis
MTLHRVEVIVVDNASTDDTAGIAEFAGARVVHEPGKGVARARQAGMEAADAPILLGTDADTRVPSVWIDAHLRHYADRSTVGAAGGVRFAGAHPLFRLYKSGARGMHRIIGLMQSVGLSRTDPRQGVSGANYSHRTKAGLDIGYDPHLNLGEDMLMGIKLAERGTVVHDPSPEIRVSTDGRRFRTAGDVARHTAEKIGMLMRRKLYRNLREGEVMDFTDVREG